MCRLALCGPRLCAADLTAERDALRILAGLPPAAIRRTIRAHDIHADVKRDEDEGDENNDIDEKINRILEQKSLFDKRLL